MKNNITQSIKTTIIGSILLVAAGVYQYLLYQNSIFEFNYVPAALLVIGLGLVLAPDSIIDGLKSIIKKKSEG